MKSALLLAGFPLVLPAVCFSFVLTLLLAFGSPDAFLVAGQVFLWVLGVVVLATLVWLPIGYLMYQWMIDQATGARLIGRDEEPRLWSIYEDLCQRCAMRMPALRIIETDALNALASGLKDGEYSVTVTRGLLDALDDAELEGVLAHEIAHIRNQDCRLMVVATILVGLIPILHDIALKVFWAIVMTCLSIYRGVAALLAMPLLRLVVDVTYGLTFWACKGIAYLIGAAGYFCATLIHFCLSRRREFLADAGAVAITGNPDALISALRKVSCNSAIDTSIEGVRELLFDNSQISSLFATHPPIEHRIAALERQRGHGARQEPPASHRGQPDDQPAAVAVVTPDDPAPPDRRSNGRTEPWFEPVSSEIPFVAAAALEGYAQAIGGYRRLLLHAMGSRPEEMAPDDRTEIYLRARMALASRLETMDPPLPADEAEQLEQALDDAVRVLEAEARQAEADRWSIRI